MIYRFVIRVQPHPSTLPVPLNFFVGWDEVLVNEGTRQLREVDAGNPAEDFVLVPIYEDEVAWAPLTPDELEDQATQNRVPASSPLKLDYSGKVIVPETTTGVIGPTTYVPVIQSQPGLPVEPNAGTPSSYEIYDRKDFAELGLPDVGVGA